MTTLSEVRDLIKNDMGYIKDRLDGIDNHLSTLNGSVADNTSRSISNRAVIKTAAWSIGILLTLSSLVIVIVNVV